MTDTSSIRHLLISDPIAHVPAWTVAAFDPTRGDLPRRELDLPGNELYLQALAEAGAPGVLLAASTGWGHARTFEEHRSTLLSGGKTELEGCVKQALLRIEDPLDKNLTLLEELAALDYGMVWSRRGSTLPPSASDEEVAQQMLPLVKAAAKLNLPVGLYSISTVDGAPLRAEAARILLDRLGEELARQVVAVKITEPDFESSTQTYLGHPAFRGKKIVQGWDAFYAQAMQEGLLEDGRQQCGATSGAAAAMVYAYRAMYQAVQEQDWENLAQLQEVVSRVFYSMQGPDKSKFPDLQTAKWVMGLGHPLTEERSRDDADRLLATLRDLMSGPSREPAKLILDSLLLMDRHPQYRSPLRETLLELQES